MMAITEFHVVSGQVDAERECAHVQARHTLKRLDDPVSCNSASFSWILLGTSDAGDAWVLLPRSTYMTIAPWLSKGRDEVMDQKGGLALPSLARDEQSRVNRFVKRFGLRTPTYFAFASVGLPLEPLRIALMIDTTGNPTSAIGIVG
jgi:hypothetical protein